MERFTISLDEALAKEFVQLIAARGYSKRSEAAVRELAERLTSLQHDHYHAHVHYRPAR